MRWAQLAIPPRLDKGYRVLLLAIRLANVGLCGFVLTQASVHTPPSLRHVLIACSAVFSVLAIWSVYDLARRAWST
jgi:hypothetical protein